jgi:hypothetical protein
MSKIAMTFAQAAKAASVTEDDLLQAIRDGALTIRTMRNKGIVLATELQVWLETLPVWECAVTGREDSKRLRRV